MKMVGIVLALFLGAMEACAQSGSPQEKTGSDTPAAVYQNFASGYAQGLKEHRFIVVFFKDKSAYTTQMEAEMRKMRLDGKFSAAFVFAEALLPDDEYGMKAAKQMKAGGVPAVSVLAPASNMLKEMSRYEGVFTFEKMREGIVAEMCKNPKYQDGKDVVDARKRWVRLPHASAKKWRIFTCLFARFSNKVFFLQATNRRTPATALSSWLTCVSVWPCSLTESTISPKQLRGHGELLNPRNRFLLHGTPFAWQAGTRSRNATF